MSRQKFSGGARRFGVASIAALALGFAGIIAPTVLIAGCGGSGSESATATDDSRVEFSQVSGANAYVDTITRTDAAAEFSGTVLNASLTENGSTATRILSLQIGMTSVDALTPGATFPISSTMPPPVGRAALSYIQRHHADNSDGQFWFANSGSVVIDERSGDTVKLRIVNATLTPEEAVTTTEQPAGTFTINASATFHL